MPPSGVRTTEHNESIDQGYTKVRACQVGSEQHLTLKFSCNLRPCDFRCTGCNLRMVSKFECFNHPILIQLHIPLFRQKVNREMAIIARTIIFISLNEIRTAIILYFLRRVVIEIAQMPR